MAIKAKRRRSRRREPAPEPRCALRGILADLHDVAEIRRALSGAGAPRALVVSPQTAAALETQGREEAFVREAGPEREELAQRVRETTVLSIDQARDAVRFVPMPLPEPEGPERDVWMREVARDIVRASSPVHLPLPEFVFAGDDLERVEVVALDGSKTVRWVRAGESGR